MLSGPWYEATSSGKVTREIRTSEWDAEAFLTILDIIHGQHALIPKSVSLELLAKIAAIVDYYDCNDVVEIFVDRWILLLQDELPSSYGKECMLWMSISWVFLRVDVLQSMTKIAIVGCRQRIQTMSLPLPDALTRIIEDKRNEVLNRILQILNSLRESLCRDPGCSSECTYMLLGALTRQMHEAKISEL
ncbi:hypothetical protein V8C37DRAFT_401048 [Trichoderma ceciliae]